MKDISELLTVAAKISKDASFLVFDEKRWELVKEKNNLKIFRAPSPVIGSAFKAETIVNCSIEKAFDYLHPSCEYYKLQWDPHVVRTEVLQELSHDTLVVRYVMKPLLKGLIASTDSLNIVIQNDGVDFKSVEMGSVVHDDFPKGDYNRGWSYASAVFLFRTEDPNKCKAVSILEALDVGSKLVPRALIDVTVPFMMQQFMEGVEKMETLKWSPFGPDVAGRRKPDSIINTKILKMPADMLKNAKQHDQVENGHAAVA